MLDFLAQNFNHVDDIAKIQALLKDKKPYKVSLFRRETNHDHMFFNLIVEKTGVRQYLYSTPREEGLGAGQQLDGYTKQWEKIFPIVKTILDGGTEYIERVLNCRTGKDFYDALGLKPVEADFHKEMTKR